MTKETVVDNITEDSAIMGEAATEENGTLVVIPRFLSAHINIGAPTGGVQGSSITVTGTVQCFLHVDLAPGEPDVQDGMPFVKKVEVRFNGGAYQPASKVGSTWANWTFTGNPGSVSQATIEARVTADHPVAADDVAIDSVTVQVDTAGPQLAINAIPDVTKSSPPYTTVISGTVSDSPAGVKRVEYRIGSSGSFTNAARNGSTWSGNVTLPGLGSHTLTVCAFDNVNNQTIRTATITVRDATAPALAITAPPEGTQFTLIPGGVTLPLRGTTSDSQTPVNLVEWALNGQSQFTPATPTGPGGNWASWSANILLPTAQVHTIFVRARDGAGNTATTQRQFTVVVPAEPVNPLTDVRICVAHNPPLTTAPCNLPVPDTDITDPSEDVDRREHCLLTRELIDALGLTFNAEVANFGHIRVFHHTVAHVSTEVDFAANFTVVGVITAADGTEIAGRIIQVHPNRLSSNGSLRVRGGVNKLTGQADNTIDMGTCTIQHPIPSTTYNGSCHNPDEDDPANDVWFEEPIDETYFVECYEQGSNDIALLVPHGGGIERWTDDQIAPFRNALTTANPAITPTVWSCFGQYEDPDDLVSTHAQWHVTSVAINPASFPGLQQLLNNTPEYSDGVQFRYAVALHGNSGMDGTWLVIGGQSTDADKNIMRDHINAALEAATPDLEFTCYIVQEDGTLDPALPDDEEFDDVGMHDRNIVNRLSPNPDFVAHQGAFQIEQSDDMRENYHAVVAQAIAEALHEMITSDQDEEE